MIVMDYEINETNIKNAYSLHVYIPKSNVESCGNVSTISGGIYICLKGTQF